MVKTIFNIMHFPIKLVKFSTLDKLASVLCAKNEWNCCNDIPVSLSSVHWHFHQRQQFTRHSEQKIWCKNALISCFISRRIMQFPQFICSSQFLSLGNLHWDLINHEKMLENCSMTSSSIDNVRRDEMSRTFNVFAIPHIIIARFTQRASSSHEKMTLMDALERWKKKTCFKLTVRIGSYLTHSLWCATRAKYREKKNEKVLDEPLRTSRGDGAFRVQSLDTILWNFIQYLEEILVIIISCYLTVHYDFFLTSFFTWKII